MDQKDINNFYKQLHSNTINSQEESLEKDELDYETFPHQSPQLEIISIECKDLNSSIRTDEFENDKSQINSRVSRRSIYEYLSFKKKSKGKIPEFFMLRKEREMYTVRKNIDQCNSFRSNTDLRIPAKNIANLTITVSHSVINKNSIVFYFKCEGCIESKNGATSVFWHVFREMNKQTIFSDVEKYLDSVKYADEKVLDMFINTNIVETMQYKTTFIKWNDEIVNVNVINNHLVIGNDHTIKIENVEKYKKHYIILNKTYKYIFECSSTMERNVWFGYLSSFSF